MRAIVQKWGNSMALRVPKILAEEVHVARGSPVDLSVSKGKLIILPLRKPVFSLKKLLAGINKKNRHREISTGKAVGREIW